MATLIEYLSNLNSADSQQGIWVDPSNVDDFIVQPRIFGYNAQSYGDRVCIGTLDNLSYGFQSTSEALENLLESGTYTYNGRKVRVNKAAIVEAWSSGNLDEAFAAAIEEDAAYICKAWSQVEAEGFVADRLPTLLEADAEEVYA